jgi:hypothetical protein
MCYDIRNVMMVTHTPSFAELLDAACKLAIAPSIVHPETKERVIHNFVLNLQCDSADIAIIYDRFAAEMNSVSSCPLIYTVMVLILR